MTSDMDKMRATQVETMEETVYIQRLTKTSDGTGGYSQAWSTIATTPGRIAPWRIKEGELELAGKMTNLQGYVVTLPAETNITEQERLQINGRQYEIVGIERRTNQTALPINCVEVQ